MKRILVMFLAVMMLFGCFGAVAEQKEGCDEFVKLRIAYWDSNAFGDDTFYEDICKMFNMEIEFINLDWSNYGEQTRLWAASGEFPDVSVINLPHTDYFSFASQGVLAPIPEDLSAYPSLQAFEGQSLMELFRVDGQLYTIPRTHNFIYGPDAIPAFRYIIRKDWMEAAGYSEVPDNYVDFFGMLAKFVELKLGGENTIGLTSTVGNIISIPQSAYVDVPNTWTKNETGEWYHSMLDEDNIEWLSVMRDAYKSGAIDPDFMLVVSDNDTYERFNAGNVGAICVAKTAAEYHVIKEDFEAATGLDADETLTIFSAYLYPYPDSDKSAGTQRYMDPLIGTGTGFSAAIDPVVYDRALRFIDYLLSDEGKIHCKMGLEGRDYEYDADGNFVSLLPVNEATGEQYLFTDMNPTTAISGLAYWMVDFCLMDPSHQDSCISELQATYDWINENCYPAERTLEVEWWGGNDDFTSWNPSGDYNSGIVNIMLSDGDIATEYKELVDLLMASGGIAATEAVNANFE